MSKFHEQLEEMIDLLQDFIDEHAEKSLKDHEEKALDQVEQAVACLSEALDHLN